MRPFVTPRTTAHQTPLPMRFSRQKYWNGLLFPPPGDPLDPGVEPLTLALAGIFFTTAPPGKPQRASDYLLYSEIEISKPSWCL